ncbi:MAG: hypothetical protein ACRDD7_08565 [Peptostreptococcaceae bacterium]
MQRWQRINVGLSLIGLLIFIIGLLLVKKMPLFLFVAMFGLGMFFKTFRNIYKNEAPAQNKKIKRPEYDKRKKKK